jgi:hypothetical protein
MTTFISIPSLLDVTISPGIFLLRLPELDRAIIAAGIWCSYARGSVVREALGFSECRGT